VEFFCDPETDRVWLLEITPRHSRSHAELFAGKWCSYNAPPDLPYDQREEDGGALVYETEPLTERCEVQGAPAVRVAVSADSRWP
jgi:predicted acyl esterase